MTTTKDDEELITLDVSSAQPLSISDLPTLSAGPGTVLTVGPDSDITFSTVPNYPRVEWQFARYLLRDKEGDVVGLYHGPITGEEEGNLNYTIRIGDEFIDVDCEEVSEAVYETHIAFETAPVTEIEREVSGNTLLTPKT